MYVSIFVLLIAGAAAEFIAGLWGRAWVWSAIVLLVLMFVAMYARASTPRSAARGRSAHSRRSGLMPRGSQR